MVAEPTAPAVPHPEELAEEPEVVVPVAPVAELAADPAALVAALAEVPAVLAVPVVQAAPEALVAAAAEELLLPDQVFPLQHQPVQGSPSLQGKPMPRTSLIMKLQQA